MKKDIIYNLFYLFFERNQWQKYMIQFTYYLWLRHYNKTCQINFGTLNIVKKVYSSQTQQMSVLVYIAETVRYIKIKKVCNALKKVNLIWYTFNN